MTRTRILAVIILMLACPILAGAADKVYTWRAEDGSVVFSDTPPPGDQAESLDVAPAPASATTPDVERERLLQRSQQIGERIEQRVQRRQAVMAELDEINEKIRQAEQALQEGPAPHEGELQHLAGGRNRLAPAYFERLRQQELALEALRQRQSALHDELQSLR